MFIADSLQHIVASRTYIVACVVLDRSSAGSRRGLFHPTDHIVASTEGPDGLGGQGEKVRFFVLIGALRFFRRPLDPVQAWTMASLRASPCSCRSLAFVVRRAISAPGVSDQKRGSRARVGVGEYQVPGPQARCLRGEAKGH